MSDRRRYPRFELKVTAKYKDIDTEELFKKGRIKNISAEGVCFESDHKFKIGTHVRLEVDLGDSKPPIILVGEIKWSTQIKGEEGAEKRYNNGVKLVDIRESDEYRFLKYYCDKMVEKLTGYLNM